MLSPVRAGMVSAMRARRAVQRNGCLSAAAGAHYPGFIGAYDDLRAPFLDNIALKPKEHDFAPTTSQAGAWWPLGGDRRAIIAPLCGFTCYPGAFRGLSPRALNTSPDSIETGLEPQRGSP